MMRMIQRTTSFKRDYKRIKSTPRHNKNVDLILTEILGLLSNDQPLPDMHRDHSLIGNL